MKEICVGTKFVNVHCNLCLYFMCKNVCVHVCACVFRLVRDRGSGVYRRIGEGLQFRRWRLYFCPLVSERRSW